MICHTNFVVWFCRKIDLEYQSFVLNKFSVYCSLSKCLIGYWSIYVASVCFEQRPVIIILNILLMYLNRKYKDFITSFADYLHYIRNSCKCVLHFVILQSKSLPHIIISIQIFISSPNKYFHKIIKVSFI